MEIKIPGFNISITRKSKEKKPKRAITAPATSSKDGSTQTNDVLGRVQVAHPHVTSNSESGYNTINFKDITAFDKKDLAYFTNILGLNKETNSSKSTDTKITYDYDKEEQERLDEFKKLLNKYKDNKNALEQIDGMLIRHELAFVSAASDRFYDEEQYPREYPREYTRIILPNSEKDTDIYLSDIEKKVLERVNAEREMFNNLNSANFETIN